MAPPTKEAMAAAASAKAERDLQIAEAKASLGFQRIQSLFDSMSKISDSAEDRENFICNCAMLDNIRAEYIAAIEEKNRILAETSSSFQPNYFPIISFDELFAKIKVKLASLTAPAPPATVFASPKVEAPAPASHSNIQLPRLELCSFDGNIQKWPIFYENFRTMVHENRSLTDFEKVQYLIGRLTGDAMSVCSGLIPTGDNYSIIWTALCDKYNDKRALASSYLDQLLKIKPVKSASPAALESFVDKFSAIISALKHMKVDDLSELMFVHIGMQCLDIETVKGFETSIRGMKSFPSSAQLIDFVRDQHRMLNRSNLFNTENNRPNRSNQPTFQSKYVRSQDNRQKSQNTYTFLNVQDGRYVCVCCQIDGHQLYLCPQFNSLPPYERFRLVKNNRLCFNCLSDKHMLSECKSVQGCKLCSLSHHSLIHLNIESPVQSNEIAIARPAAAPREFPLPQHQGSVRAGSALRAIAPAPQYPTPQYPAPARNVRDFAPNAGGASRALVPIAAFPRTPLARNGHAGPAPAPHRVPTLPATANRSSTMLLNENAALAPVHYNQEDYNNDYVFVDETASAPSNYNLQNNNDCLTDDQLDSQATSASALLAPAQDVSLCINENNNNCYLPQNVDSAPRTVLLGTAMCLAQSPNSTELMPVRVLVDCGSMRDIITTDCCERLGIPIRPSQNAHVSGLGDVVNKTQGVTNLVVHSRLDRNVSFAIEPHVVDRITSELPTSRVNVEALPYLQGLPLADDTYHSPGVIDLILGCDIFTQILMPKKIYRAPGEPVAIETLLGYLVMGSAPTGIETDVSRTFCAFDSPCVSRFFEIEDLPKKGELLTPEEQECENIFVDTTTRDELGRYVVALPMRRDPALLGKSKHLAERRFLSLERRLHANPEIKSEYDKTILDYLEKDYLSPVDESDKSTSPQYVIPHHAVVRKDKLTTKTRLVLNASMPTDSGYSLNDILHTGQNLQSDLFRIILNFRMYKVAISADIRQMYLRILVDTAFRRFQRIFYRFSPEEPLQLYEFSRVTFGMTSSPFLAMRTIRLLVKDERDKFPLAAAALEKDSLYMDDLAVSCPDAREAAELSSQLIQLFSTGGFELVKFASNSPEFLASIPADRRVTDLIDFSSDDMKVLGLHWIPSADQFAFSVSTEERNCTKRNILSTIARFWDLTGFAAPITLFAKLIVKSLWESCIDWDEVPPQNVVNAWTRFISELPLLKDVKIPRYLGIEPRVLLTLLGFSDASERAYGGVIYLHVYCPNTNEHCVSLLCAKSRVAPARTVITLARLELCGALVLAQLMNTVVDTYASRCQVHNTLAFSDSKVALAWIHSTPARWHTFVANRVARIQKNIEPRHFHHIKGTDNPADCLSRGLTPAQLIDHPLWFNGPAFAKLPYNEWPIQDFDPKTVENPPEAKAKVLVTTISNDKTAIPVLYELASRVSSWSRLLRIVVYVLRFIRKLPRKFESSHIDIAESAVVRAVQQVHFGDEIKSIQNNRSLPPVLAKLNAFLENDTLRVGGRLTNSDLDYDSKHPILLPARDHVVDLIIDHYHKINLHTGPGLLLSLLRQKYWILSARNLVRKRVHLCNVCFRNKPRPEFPLMGELPACRVRETPKAFLNTGVDYAGPIQTIPFRRRGVRAQKSYICLFICLVTHAVHIELASDLTTEVFLNAFKRFLSRRGPVRFMHSDCGTNFVGCKSHLKALYELVNSPGYNEEFTSAFRENRIEWKMNPPLSPHHGGMWESNIKCVKSHLNKIVGKQLLTFEEMQTVLTQIESLLNSRPLSVLSADPAEPLPLTPAHFLTLTPLKSIPALDLTQECTNLLQRKHLVDRLVQSFWNRWRIEYLNTLQSRQKWHMRSESIKEGIVVLIKSDNSAPLQWPIGIIVKTYPGADGVVRVADVKTKNGIYRRPVVKLCPLPTQ